MNISSRSDPAIAKAETFTSLKQRAGKYGIRTPDNENQKLKRSVGRARQKPLIEYNGFLHPVQTCIRTARAGAGQTKM